MKIQSTVIKPLKVINKGWLTGIEHQVSPHFSLRAPDTVVELLVVHNISLPPAQFGGPYITDLFLGRLDASADKYFQAISHLKVSAHCLIRRDGQIIQYVSFDHNAWHAGISSFNGREQCNEFSIGIELEGTDDIPYTDVQYLQLAALVTKLQASYSFISHNNIVGHCDIAPGRKTDPGEAFDWQHFKQCLRLNK